MGKELTEEARELIKNINAMSANFKVRLNNPKLTESELLDCLGEILSGPVGGLAEEFKRLKIKYKNSDVLKYIKITRMYMDAKIGPFLKTAGIEDAPLIYFLIKNLDWAIDSFPNTELLNQVLCYHLKHNREISDKEQRKGYQKLLRLSVRRAIVFLIFSDEEYELLKNDIQARSWSSQDIKKQIANMREAMKYNVSEVVRPLKQLYKKRKTYPYYKSIGWFSRILVYYLLCDRNPKKNNVIYLSRERRKRNKKN